MPTSPTSDANLLSTEEVIARIAHAARSKRPFSFIRCGDGENLCMAQETVMTRDEVMRERWAQSRSKGVKLPDLTLRDRLVAAVREADLVGVHRWEDRMILTHPRLKRGLFERVAEHYKLQPKALCDATVTRFFPQLETFWNTLRPYRLLLVSRWAGSFADIVKRSPYTMHVAAEVSCSSFAEVDSTIARAVSLRPHFDVALISAGVNALVLAAEIAKKTDRVAIDFGKGMQFMSEGVAGLSAPTSRYAPR